METYYHYNLLTIILNDIFKYHNLVAKEKIDLLEQSMTEPFYVSYKRQDMFTDEMFSFFEQHYRNIKTTWHAPFFRFVKQNPIYCNIPFYELVIDYYNATPEQKENNTKCIANFIALLRVNISSLFAPTDFWTTNKHLISVNNEFLKNKHFQLWLKYIVYCIEHR